jgi:hypothetical protein
MPDIESFVKNLQTRIESAANETEVRSRFCEEVRNHFHVDDFRMERHRSDAYLNHIIFEFKDKGLFNGKTTSAKYIEAYEQLTTKYIPDKASADARPKHKYIGVAIDGEHYNFVYFEENDAHRHTALLPINEEGIYPLVKALLSDSRRVFTVENLIADFGASARLAQDLIKELSGHLDSCLKEDTEIIKVKMLFQEWKELFAQATSLGAIGQARMDHFLQSIGLTPPFDYTKALFVLHTYNALLFKLIAAEVVSVIRFTHYSGFTSEAAGQPLQDLRYLLDTRIEHGEIFRANGINNFIEGTFFSWYIEAPPAALLGAIRQLLARLNLYIFPTTTRHHIRDVVKAVYQNLVPGALRKNIGEFYTPEWLVEFVLDESGFKDDNVLSKKLLDPCCGSGNFIIHGISRFKEVAQQTGLSERNTRSHILQQIIGFDLNPLAVISSRLNYLLAISDMLSAAGEIEIPVYLADAVYAPETTDASGITARSYRVGTVMGDIELLLPERLVQQQEVFNQALLLMENHIEIGSSQEEYLARLESSPQTGAQLAANPEWKPYLGDMYHRIQQLERQNWNRIWCRVVRNYFASISIGKVDIIAGNPPWVRWSELPEDYRERIKPTCERYNIFSSTPYHGGNELDISGMIAYIVSDRWLREGGILSFVITQIHFQAPSSEGFRNFELPDGTPLEILKVHDFIKVRPFPTLGNKPAVFTWKRGAETTYPVPYLVWDREDGVSISEDAELVEVLERIRSTSKQALALAPDQRWSLLAPEHHSLLDHLAGGSRDWRGRKGITTDLNAAYFVELIGPGSRPGLVRIRSYPPGGRKPVPLIDSNIESELIYPLLKGAAQIDAFSYTPYDLVAIVPNRVITSIPPVEEFRRNHPEAYRYFHRLNQREYRGTPLLESRSTWRTRMEATGAPFYAIYNVGEYTFSPYKVVWAEMAQSLVAAVVTQENLPYEIENKLIIPDHKVYFAPVDDEEAAHFLCAMLNSEPVRIFVNSFTVKIQVGTIFRHLHLPPYDPDNEHHQRLAQLSKSAHEVGLTEDSQTEIDTIAWTIVEGITTK